MIDDALKGIGVGIGKPPVTPAIQQAVVPLIDPAAMKVALDGNKIVVSAVVGLKDARRLLKRLEANIALLKRKKARATKTKRPPTEAALLLIGVTHLFEAVFNFLAGVLNQPLGNARPGVPGGLSKKSQPILKLLTFCDVLFLHELSSCSKR